MPPVTYTMRRKILIIDDDEAITELMNTALSGEGFVVRAVNDPRQAMDVSRTFQPDLILLDLRMPHISGEELLVLLTADPDLSRVPVIALSAGDEELPLARASVRKPFDFADFLGLLERVLAPPIPA